MIEKIEAVSCVIAMPELRCALKLAPTMIACKKTISCRKRVLCSQTARLILNSALRINAPQAKWLTGDIDLLLGPEHFFIHVSEILLPVDVPLADCIVSLRGKRIEPVLLNVG